MTLTYFIVGLLAVRLSSQSLTTKMYSFKPLFPPQRKRPLVEKDLVFGCSMQRTKMPSVEPILLMFTYCIISTKLKYQIHVTRRLILLFK